MKIGIKIILLLVCLLNILVAYAYNLRQISSRDGLSNSSVLCLAQSSSHFLWIGTFDGLNKYDGRSITVYKPDIKNKFGLTSNVIRNVIETDGKYLWISNKGGINKLSLKKNIIEECYTEFEYNEDARIAKDSKGNLFVLGKKGFLSIYDSDKNNFTHYPVDREINPEHIRAFVIDNSGIIWIVQRGRLWRYSISYDDKNKPAISATSSFVQESPIEFLFYDNHTILIIDNKGDVFTTTGQYKKRMCNIQGLIYKNGMISSCIFDGDDILIGFNTNGLIRLNAAHNYQAEKLNINCGVFALCKDTVQNIIWIGTDGQGVYALTKDDYSLNSLTLSELPVDKKRPVRAIYADKYNNLWLGTKDNGILRIKNYQSATTFNNENLIHYTRETFLTNEEVFAFAGSSAHNVLWIGSNGPQIDYYRYSDNKIHQLINHTKHTIKFVHAMFEACDSLLWVASGSALLKIFISNKNHRLETDSIKQYEFEVKNKQQYNNIYALLPEGDSVIWIGMRGNGLIRFNTKTEKYKIFTFDKNRVASINDVLCIYRDRNNVLWLGTSYGIIKVNFKPNGNFSYKNINENDGLPNNSIHGIIEDSKGKLWLSSNTGIIIYDPQKGSFRQFNHKTGLKTIEYCDNAFFYDKQNTTVLFGGVDGITKIQETFNVPDVTKRHVIPFHFTGIKIFNETYDLSDFEKIKNGKPYIELSYKQNFFVIKFIATDFINGESGIYSYKLENFNDIWLDSRANEAQFTNIAPGTYKLSVRYNDGNGYGPLYSIKIVVRPPWFLSTFSKLVYFLILLGSIFLGYKIIRKRYKKKQTAVAHELNEKYKEEIYKSKLRFFTNITHELCSPLTLIHGPSERIMEHQNSDSVIKKYAGIIKSNTERLNGLIQEVIDFSRMETDFVQCRIRRLNISNITKDITNSFQEVAERNKIKFHIDFDHSLFWNTDSSCISKILGNLISNAFKYTQEKGEIYISVYVDNEMLVIKIKNTGKGIRKEDIPFIFDRYTVMDNITENSIKGFSSRNGLGLAICHSMVELLNGKIEVESETNGFTCFTVTLPPANIIDSNQIENNESHIPDLIKSTKHKDRENSNKRESPPMAQHQARILVIDDNKELLWMLNEMLSTDYIVFTATDGYEGIAVVEQESPDLIVADIMMPNLDGISFTRHIRQNKHTLHIPLIILSSLHSNDEKITGLESGADAYISKPFDIQYLKAEIKHLLAKKKNLERYYNSSASAFEFSGGQLMKKEDKNFLQIITEIIYDNLDNSNFTPNDLAVAMQMDIRKLYRKFKEIEQLPPKDYIKELRINHASKLLLTTTYTIEEVMYKSGFLNRSHFYKEFAKRMKHTPKEYRETNRIKDNTLGKKKAL